MMADCSRQPGRRRRSNARLAWTEFSAARSGNCWQTEVVCICWCWLWRWRCQLGILGRDHYGRDAWCVVNRYMLCTFSDRLKTFVFDTGIWCSIFMANAYLDFIALIFIITVRLSVYEVHLPCLLSYWVRHFQHFHFTVDLCRITNT